MTSRLTPERLDELREMLAEADLDGWLLYDFREQNPLAHRLLDLDKTTRRAFAIIPRTGSPTVLRHHIESAVWKDWPWEQRSYRGWRDLESGLSEMVHGFTALAMEYAPADSIPTVDRVPAGVVEMVRARGVEVRSSANLVSAFCSRWSARGLALHREAAASVSAVAREAFLRAAAAVEAGAGPYEGELMDWIRARLIERGLTEDVDCIVASGQRSADPHYLPLGRGERIERDRVLLIDLWGRHASEGIPADQTWMGYLGADPPERVRSVWGAVKDARDRALEFLAEARTRGKSIHGFEVDEVARTLLADRGFGSYFTHRLGHSIDHELHGSGPNLDNLETRDERRLISGIGFSVEPGVYLPREFGVRSEVNVYWSPGGPGVTQPELQDSLLLPGI